MQIFRIFIVMLFFLTNFFGFGQVKVLNIKEVNDLYEKGHDYFRKADFENSLKTLRIALYHAIKIKNDSLTSEIYNRIGRNFGELSEDQKALLYFEKALFFAKKSNYKDNELIVKINICNLKYFGTKKTVANGMQDYVETLNLSKQLKDTSSSVTISMNIAWIFFDNKQFDKGYPYLQYLNKNYKQYGDPSFYSSIAMLNGVYFSSINENETAESFFKKGINTGKDIILREDKEDLYFAYSEFLAKIGNYKSAFENLKKANTIKEKFYNEKKLKKANIEGINFELDESKREIDKIEFEKYRQAKQLKNSKTISYLLSFIAIIFGFLLFVVYRNYKNKFKSNKKLEASNLELSLAKEVAEEASKVKSQFVSTITHELRTPLYGVIGMTDILQDEHKELEDNPHIKSLKFSAQYLLSLVNDILKINKLEENNSVLDKDSINLETEIQEIINSFLFLSKSKKNKLDYFIDDSIPKFLIADKLRLTQILINLIGNALKFTSEGEVFIEIIHIKKENNFHLITFKIIDNGAGIALEDQEKIFEKFVQVGRKETDYQGTGLGLAIVKRLLSSLNSEILLESTLDIGTTFSFSVLLEEDLHPKDQNDLTTFEKSENYKILVVEDNKINQVVTKKIIEKNLGNCVLANDGYEAISMLETQIFDIILMDINMPGIDGYQTTIKIRESGNQTPIIALTASSKEQIFNKVIASGMNDIVVKPFESIILIQTIQRNLKK